jgi:hypothetical protein
MGLKLATCSADGFMYSSPNILQSPCTPISRLCARRGLTVLTGLCSQPNLRGHGHHEPQPLVAHRRIRISQGVRSSSLHLSLCAPICRLSPRSNVATPAEGATASAGTPPPLTSLRWRWAARATRVIPPLTAAAFLRVSVSDRSARAPGRPSLCPCAHRAVIRRAVSSRGEGLGVQRAAGQVEGRLRPQWPRRRGARRRLGAQSRYVRVVIVCSTGGCTCIVSI